MPIHYVTYSALPPEPQLGSLLDLLAVVFANQSRADWLADLIEKAATYPAFQTLLALADEQVVGCKIGYTHHLPNTFYSWLGGVYPAYRGLGIAAELMRQQHAYCHATGYAVIQTHTYNQWRDMLILNLRHGFEIIGTQPGKHGLTIVLEKRLM